MTDFVFYLLSAEKGWGALLLLVLGLLGTLWSFTRRYLVEHEDPLALLHNRFDGLTRFLLQHRRSKKTLPVSLVAVGLGGGMLLALERKDFLLWAFRNAALFLGLHAGLVLLALVLWFRWDRKPKYIQSGDGRADAQFKDVPEDFGPCEIQDGRRVGDGQPMAELLGFRDPSMEARWVLAHGQRSRGYLTLVSLTWDTLSRHILIFGAQGSGKTTSIFGHIQHSALCPWIYQDSKAELPFRDEFPNACVWGLDVRGHASRSGVWNPMEEIRSKEDRDLMVDYVFPSNPHDANPWVRDMARAVFGAILASRRWSSIQEIARTLRESRLEPFLAELDPIYRDAMAEPKSQVPVLQDLVVSLSRWETARISAITEGPSTVTIDDFIARGGYVMNCEMSDALRVPVHCFWGMIFGRLRNRAEGASPIILLLDEFGDCGRLPNIERALVLLRSKGVSIMAGIQNLGLLQDVYPRNWQAVLQGFGTRIWLTRNLEDDLREKLSRVVGKWTRRVPPANKNSRPTDKEADLMPLDAWGRWSEERAALARSHGFTYWLPLSLKVTRPPLGALVVAMDPWEEAESLAKAAVQAVTPPDWKPEPLPIPVGLKAVQPSAEAPEVLVLTVGEDWL
jgi:hypothetical protein